MSDHKRLSNHEFLERTGDYLAADASIWTTDAPGNAIDHVSLPGLEENTFYLFDADALLAFTHAIEDLALDEANGKLLASFPDCRHFDSLRERYWQLGATLDEVVVFVGDGKARRHGRARFRRPKGKGLCCCWTVIYQGRRVQALVLGQQVKPAPSLAASRFFGFYSLNPILVERVRQSCGETIKGRCPTVHEFDRLRAIDQTAKWIRRELADEQRALEGALRRLQTDSNRYHTRNFEGDFGRSLKRLAQFTERLPMLLSPTPHSVSDD